MNGRSARQRFLGKDSAEVLRRSSVAIIGNCGGGSHVAQQLAHIGIGRFALVDPDITQDVNLNRMIGSCPADAVSKTEKTAVLDRLIRSIQPDAEVVPLTLKWQECAVALRGCDIVFGCVDGYEARSELEAYCRRFLIPYIDIGMDVTPFGNSVAISGQVITSFPGRPCMWCMGFLTKDLLAREAQQYGAAGPRPQVVWPNGVLASVAVGTAIRLLTPWNTEPVCPFLEYDGNRQIVAASSRLAHISARGCPHYAAAEVGDPFWHSAKQSR
jgi:molybdopterin-synthase adenylyltransferase